MVIIKKREQHMKALRPHASKAHEQMTSVLGGEPKKLKNGRDVVVIFTLSSCRRHLYMVPNRMAGSERDLPLSDGVTPQLRNRGINCRCRRHYDS